MAKNITRHVQHIKSVDITTITVDGQDVNVAKLPEWGDLKDGEIAVNYNDGYETISIRNNNNEVVAFPNINTVNTLIEEKAQATLTFDSTPTADSINPVTSGGIKTYVDNGDKIQTLTTYQSSTPLAVGDTHDQALSKLSKIIDDNEIFTARALTDLNDNKQDKITDLSTIRAGAALGATALQAETQLSKGITTGSGNVVTDISVNNHQITLTKGATALTEHQSIKTINGNTMVGTGNVSVGTITGITMNNASKGTSGVVDLGTVITSETQLSKGTTTGSGNAVTDISVDNHQITLTKGATFLVENDLANYADGAEYDSEEHLIYLKHGNTRLANPINAADFIKDGMVDTVEVTEGNLVITFNTDSGKENIEISLTDIFNPSLYYTKEEIDEHELVTAAALTELHDTKQELLTFDNVPTSGSSNPVTSSGIKNYVDNTVSSLAISELVEPEASTPLAVGDTYDDAFAKLSKIIRDNELATAGALTELHNTKQELLTFDSTPTADSTNPVTSGGIKTYVDAGDSIQSLTTYQSSTPLAVGDTHDQALSKLSKIIDDNEIVTARALTDLNDTKQELLTFDSTPTANSQNPVTSEGIKEYVDDAIDASTPMTEITYSDLVTARNNNNLKPGTWYRITDYTTTTTQENTKSAGHQFDIVLLALSANKLAEEGWAMMHDNIYDVTFADGITKKCYINQTVATNDGPLINVVDIDTKLGLSDLADDEIIINETNKTATITNVGGYESIALTEENLPYNYFQNSNLSAWKVWYCLDNDKSRFAWADNDKAFNISYQGEDYQMVRDTSNDVQGLYAWSNDDIGTLYTNNETPQIGDNLYWQDGTLAEENELTKGIYFTGRGVIYRLIDEFNNDIKYDFKNIQFKRKLTNGQYDATNGTDTWCYTLNVWITNKIASEDASIIGNTLVNDSDNGYVIGVYKNKFGNYASNAVGNSLRMRLGNNVILTVDGGDEYYGCYSNTIGNDFSDNTIGTDFYNNAIGDYFSSNTIGNSCYNNTIGHGFVNNIIGTDFHNNAIGNNFYSNTIGNGFYGNTIGNNFYSNTIGNNSHDNAIGNHIFANTIGNNFYSNTIGNEFNGNGVGNSFKCNTIGNGFESNHIGTASTKINYVRYISVGDGVKFVDITTSATTSSSDYLQNIIVYRGIVGTQNSRKTITHPTVGDTSLTEYRPTGSQTVSV